MNTPSVSGTNASQLGGGGRGVDFGVSQCIQWNQFDSAAAARSVHTLSLLPVLFMDKKKIVYE